MTGVRLGIIQASAVFLQCIQRLQSGSPRTNINSRQLVCLSARHVLKIIEFKYFRI